VSDPVASSTGDPWEDEGFGAEDDWEGKKSVESDLEDDGDPESEDEADDSADASEGA